MATLDNQIVSTALPTIVGEFGELERFGWVGSAYCSRRARSCRSTASSATCSAANM